MRHLIDPTDLSVAEIGQIIALAEDIIANRAKYSEVCKGKKLATLFYEPSTRTRLSFTSAMLELGGSVIGFSDAASSSVSKGETVADTVRVIRCFADIIAMRHFKEGAPLVGSQYAGIPVINAGDGSHSHPTQTLTDLLTIKREKGRLDHLTIGFCGDLKFGRTVHSLIKAMSRYEGIRVVLIAPDELRLPEYMLHEIETQTEGVEFREVSTMEEVMPELDILYMTRVQKERFLDGEEFNRQRLMRSVEKALSGQWESPPPRPRYDCLLLGVTFPRDVVCRRIDERLQARLDAGMVEEVAALRAGGADDSFLEGLGLEYRYILWYLTGKIPTLDALKDELGRAIKRFAKRQMVWFQKDRDVLWLDMEGDFLTQAVRAVEDFLA